MTRRAVAHRDVGDGDGDVGAEVGARPGAATASSGTRRAIGDHGVEPQVRRVCREHLQMHLRREALGLGSFSGQVEGDHPAGRRVDKGTAQLGDEQVRDDAA